MTRLITGGTGYVGAELARMLVNRGEEVVIFDVAINYKRIEDIKDKATIVQGDLGNFSEVLNVVRDYHITEIHHMGAMLSFRSESDPWGAFNANVVGTYNLLEAARLFNVNKVMFTSSQASYGLAVGSEITDVTIQRPVTVYGVHKLFGEGLGRYYRRKFDLDFRSIRYPAVVGPGVRTPAHWDSIMIEDALVQGGYTCPVTEISTMPMLYYKDAVRAADMVLQAPKEAIKMVNYNVGGIPSIVSAKELEQAIHEFIPDADITYNPDPATMVAQTGFNAIKLFDDTYAKQEWGWTPVYTTLNEMVSSFIEEIRTNPQRYQ